MASYTKPSITEIGSIADVTRRDDWAFDYDGRIFRGDSAPTPTS